MINDFSRLNQPIYIFVMRLESRVNYDRLNNTPLRIKTYLISSSPQVSQN